MANLAGSRSWQQCNHRFLRLLLLSYMLLFPFPDAIGCRITYICTFIAMLRIECGLKGEDTQDLVGILRNLVHAPFFPCPNLWWDIVDDSRLGQLLMAEPSNTQVKRGIINQNQHIRFLLQQRLPSCAKVSLHLVKISQYSYKTHICHLAVIHLDVASFCTHLITT